MHFYRKLSLALFAFVLNSAYAWAQIPLSAEPDMILRGLQEKERVPSRLENTVITPQMEEKPDDAGAEKAFVLSDIILDDATVYNREAFTKFFTPYIGKEVSFADLNLIASAMTRQYRKDGYIFSSVIVPPQNISEGIVHFQAIEGRLSGVQLVGNYKDKNGLIKRLADKINSSGPINTTKLERYLLLIDDLPGVTVRSFVKPGTTSGGGDLIISVEEDSFEGSASIDNRGSRYFGPYRGELTGALNGFMGLHEQTILRGIATTQFNELKFFDLSHEQQLGSEGARVKARVAFTGTEPGGRISNLDIQGNSKILDLETSYPLFRSRNMNFNLIGGATVLDSKSKIAGINVAEDRVRYLHGGGHVDFADDFKGVNQLDVEVAKGLSILNSTEDGIGRSRANGDHDFLRATLTASRVQELAGDFSMFISGTGQVSSGPLLASQELSLGGGEFGRAYDSGEIAGDRGIAGEIELRYSGYLANPYIHTYQLYSFYDLGRVFNASPVVGENKTDSLASTGAGVRFNLSHDISGYVELDLPLTHKINSEDNNDKRIFFSILKRLRYKS